MKYLISSDERSDTLTLELDPEEFYDEDEPEIGGNELTEFLNWWSTPRGRGEMELEDGGYIVLVDASSGEPDIRTWSVGASDETWSLNDFPFPTMDWREGAE